MKLNIMNLLRGVWSSVPMSAVYFFAVEPVTRLVLAVHGDWLITWGSS